MIRNGLLETLRSENEEDFEYEFFCVFSKKWMPWIAAFHFFSPKK